MKHEDLRARFKDILGWEEDETKLDIKQKFTLDNLINAAKPQPLGPPTPMESMPETLAKHLPAASEGAVAIILEILANAAPDSEAIFPRWAVQSVVNEYLRITRRQ